MVSVQNFYGFTSPSPLSTPQSPQQKPNATLHLAQGKCAVAFPTVLYTLILGEYNVSFLSLEYHPPKKKFHYGQHRSYLIWENNEASEYVSCIILLAVSRVCLTYSDDAFLDYNVSKLH